MDKEPQNDRVYEFDGFRLDTSQQEVRRGAERITLTPKAVELLTLLVESRGQIVTREEILDNLWQDTYVDESNLTVTISMLRRALGSKANDPAFIETVPKRGYRFNAEVSRPTDLIVERETRTHIKIDPSGDDDVGLHAPARGRWMAPAAVVISLCALAIAVPIYLYRQPDRPATVPAPEAAARSFAVLPFKNLNKDGNDEFISVGLTDALITKLGSLHGLIVRPTSAVMPFAASTEPAKISGEKLEVQSVLEGTILKDGERVRISIQLVRVADGVIVWSGSFDENADDLFVIQDKVTAQVATALLAKLSAGERELLATPDTASSEAYELFLEGKYHWNKRSPQDLRTAISLFERSVVLDPRYAKAYAAIGASYILLGDSGSGTIQPAQAKEKARFAMQKALAINPGLAEAYAVLGNLELNFDWNQAVAERSFRRAIEINPNYPTAYHWLGWCLITQQRFDEAEAALRRAAELDPTSMAIATDQGYPAFFAGDLPRAETLFRQAVMKDGQYAAARMCLWRTLHQAGRNHETMPQIEATESIVGMDVPIVMMARGRTFAKSGSQTEALAIYKTLEKRRSKGGYVSPIFLALLAADMNDPDRTFYWLEECLKERNDYLLFLPIAPEFQPFTDDPRFAELMMRVAAG